jgi:hypothetical protein
MPSGSKKTKFKAQGARRKAQVSEESKEGQERKERSVTPEFGPGISRTAPGNPGIQAGDFPHCTR